MKPAECAITLAVYGIAAFALIRLALAVFLGVGSETGYAGYEPPMRLDGTYSYEFEPEDYERAENVDALVEIYCGGIESDAQRLGCLSHVEVDDVCIANTDARMWAIDGFIGEYGYDPCE